MNNIESCTDFDNIKKRKKKYNINNNNNIKIILLIVAIVINGENRNYTISDSENNSIVTNNVVNRSIGENRVNISNFLSNECVNKCVMWYRL